MRALASWRRAWRRCLERRPSRSCDRVRGSWPFRRLRRNKTALAFLALFIVIVAMCLLAPVYAKHIAHIGPNTNNVTGTINVGGKQKNVVSPDGVPIGPTFTSHYFFGADTNGRDLAVRLLYGGRTSLEIGGHRDRSSSSSSARSSACCADTSAAR